ncbi:hypothetical protein [Aminipila terrae]|uniref:FkbM family methyltransferase n=1 Tax=Aminipila terrae TaxID=2697030 RepID=A0A6P1MDR9_9FIRM|nr:hypothetical protein [Aminipila terrae]QHI72057.1 hypothetical protein Ami3637_06285 [Aminipila terrae]
MVSKDSRYLKAIYKDNEYFQKQIFNITNNEVFVDCGSYHGEDTIELMNIVGNIKKAYCFEPDKKILDT